MEDQEPEPIYDYKNGFVVNAVNGEVVGEIYEATPVDGFERGGHDLSERIHYEKWFEPLPKDMWFVFKNAALYLKNARGVAIDERLLVKLSREAWLQVHGWFRAENRQRIAAAAAVYMYMRLLGLYTDLKEVCRGLGLGLVERSEASKVAVRLSKQFKADRAKVIASLINMYPDPLLRAVALALLRYAKIDGRQSKSVAAALIYIASLTTGREVTQREVAGFYGIAMPSITRLSSSKPVVDIKIVRTKAMVPVEIAVPKEICREVEKFASLSEKVVCI